MATVKYAITGKPVVELIKVAAKVTGQIEAQLPLDATNFASINAQNGMLLKVDRAKGGILVPTGPTDGMMHLHYSEEKQYDPQNMGLNTFELAYSKTLYPRMYFLNSYDAFITNAIAYDTTVSGTEAAWNIVLAALGTTPVYAVPDASGWMMLTQVSATVAAAKTLLQVVAVTTLPNGDWGLEVVVLKNEA